MLDFTGQNIVVTGSTRGIGKEAAKLFLKRGGTVYITGTSQTPDEKLISELSAIGDVHYLQGDFSTDSGINNFIEGLRSITRIDVFVNNAGINILSKIDSINDEEYHKVLSVNLHAPVKISKYLAKSMKVQGYGRIVNVASIWSKITRPKRGAYTVSKNAIVGLTQTLAIELASYGVLVNAISPGFTLTELTKSTNTQEEISNISKSIPINRMANPEEMGNVILFLSSKENSYMTGQNIIVDGGFTNVWII